MIVSRGSFEEDGPALLSSTQLLGNPSSAGAGAVSQRSRWSKLRGTLQVANAVGSSIGTRHHHQLTREDSFLKKFSTRQSAAPYVPAEASDRTIAETSTAAGGNESSTAADPASIDPELGRRTSQVRRQRWRNLVRCLVANPDESPMFYWLTITALAVLYNL